MTSSLASDARKTDLSWLNVLVVDDEPQVMRTVREMLRDMGVEKTAPAKDGQEAVEIITGREDPFDLIIADWNMPRMSGLELLAQVRAADPNVAFLLLTGRADRDSVLEARDQGVSAYLRKPFSAEQLRTKMIILSKHVQAARARAGRAA